MENPNGLEKLFIEETSKTPRVEFENGILDIKGISNPENAIEFYKSLLNYVEEYSKNPAKLTKINFKFEYFSDTSSNCLLDILKKFEFIHKNGNNVVVNLNYQKDDEEMLEDFEEFEGKINIPFKFHSYKRNFH